MNDITIIIPMYNAARYIRQCMESVLAASCREIIVIDDGSVDDSLSICAEFGADNRVKLLHQSNRGVSAARNLGLEQAKGKYILFVDADDLLRGDILPEAVKAMEHSNLSCWNVSCLYGNRLVNEPEFQVGSYSAEDLLACAIAPVSPRLKCGRYFRACWGKLFDGDIIRKHHLRFDEALYIGEDSLFLLQYLGYAQNVAFLKEYGYIYRITDTSAVRRAKPDLLEQSLIQRAKLEELPLPDSPAIFTAKMALCWHIFGDLTRSDGRKWHRAARATLYDKNAVAADVPRLCRLQYRLGKMLPFGILFAVTQLVLRRRKWMDRRDEE